MAALRYRVGIDRETGRPLIGRAHLSQSLARLWQTLPNLRVMLLAYGTDLRRHLSEDVTPALALEIYDDLVTATHRWEPEYRILDLQLVSLTRIGGLGLRHSGSYFPEGRLGNYTDSEPFGVTTELSRYERSAARAA